MTIALVHTQYDNKHLDEVKNLMMSLGTPIIHAVWMECYQMYAALDGCHRLRAAQMLGITPIIEEVEYSDDMASTVTGYDGDDDYMISEICDDCIKSSILYFK